MLGCIFEQYSESLSAVLQVYDEQISVHGFNNLIIFIIDLWVSNLTLLVAEFKVLSLAQNSNVIQPFLYTT